jgi:hypothetical protein
VSDTKPPDVDRRHSRQPGENKAVSVWRESVQNLQKENAGVDESRHGQCMTDNSDSQAYAVIHCRRMNSSSTCGRVVPSASASTLVSQIVNGIQDTETD